MSKLLIFTDLDGCLLDHHDYSLGPAPGLLRKLEQLNIPVIPATSKTEAELLHLRRQLQNTHPFIIENGAAVFTPEGYFAEAPEGSSLKDDFWVKQFTRPRPHWQSLISRTESSGEKFQTFKDSSVAEIVELTGLEHAAAARASERRYGEPVAWHGTRQEQAHFISELERLGAKVLQGGRFLHVSGACDKGEAMAWLVNQYKKECSVPLTTIALGDSQNDVGMLESADIAVVIPSPSHELPRLNKRQSVYIASREGPYGWVESVSAILQTLNLK
ncbi:HAD-IIB family hydrolase [Methylomonas sp. MgM2]